MFSFKRNPYTTGLLVVVLILGAFSFLAAWSAPKSNHTHAAKWSKSRPAQKPVAAVSPAVQTFRPLQPNQPGISSPASSAQLSSPATPEAAALGRLEENLFVETYPQDNPQSRLNRLETTVFATTYPALSIPERILRLERVVIVPQMPDASSDSESKNAAQNGQSSQPSTRQTQMPVPAAGMDIASRLTDLERYILNQHYPKESAIQRLNRLEVFVYKTPQTGPLDARIRALSEVVYGHAEPPSLSSPAASSSPDYPESQPPVSTADWYRPPNMPAGNAPPPVYNNTPASYNQQSTYPASPPALSSGATQDMGVALADLENDVLKRQYSTDTVGSRLDRLENKVFQQTSPELSPEDRLDRLIAVVAADGDNPTRTQPQQGGWRALLPFMIMIPLLLL